jgi:hypothetical protein
VRIVTSNSFSGRGNVILPERTSSPPSLKSDRVHGSLDVIAVDANQLVTLSLLACSDSLQPADLRFCETTELERCPSRYKDLAIPHNVFPGVRLQRVVARKREMQSGRLTFCG